MYGGENTGAHEEDTHGIIPRIALEILEKVKGQPVQVRLSMVEIYQETFIDLLGLQPALTGDHLIDD